MMRKLLLAALCGGFFLSARADSNEGVKALLEQVDLVLFVLERNSLRMERYGLHELDSEVNILTKDISKDHCLFRIGMTAPGSRAQLISWDQEDAYRLKIIAGRKRTPQVYYLLLDKLIGVDGLEDPAMIRFDCSVEHSRILKKGQPKVRASWKSLVGISVSAGDEELSTKLVLDGRVDAACGLFVQRELFSDKVVISGRMKGQEAIEKGLLIPDADGSEEPVETPSDSQAGSSVAQDEKPVAQGQSHVVSEPVSGVEKAEVDATSKESISVLGKVVGGIKYLANLFGTPWRKLWGLLF
ncbi:hypothetical protein ACFLX2_00610 [Candidatus Dependentiae bacterium]